MSNIETKRHDVGEYVRVETLEGGGAIARPIRFDLGYKDAKPPIGWYFSIETAEKLAAELKAAAELARQLAGTEQRVT
jgi:hypothetical protein